MKTKDVLLAAGILVAIVAIVKAAQVSLTPEFWNWLAVAVPRLVASHGMRFLAGVALLLLAFGYADFLRERWRAIREDDERAAARLRQIREEQARAALLDPLDHDRNDRGSHAA